MVKQYCKCNIQCNNPLGVYMDNRYGNSCGFNINQWTIPYEGNHSPKDNLWHHIESRNIFYDNTLTCNMYCKHNNIARPVGSSPVESDFASVPPSIHTMSKEM